MREDGFGACLRGQKRIEENERWCMRRETRQKCVENAVQLLFWWGRLSEFRKMRVHIIRMCVQYTHLVFYSIGVRCWRVRNCLFHCLRIVCRLFRVPVVLGAKHIVRKCVIINRLISPLCEQPIARIGWLTCQVYSILSIRTFRICDTHALNYSVLYEICMIVILSVLVQLPKTKVTCA